MSVRKLLRKGLALDITPTKWVRVQGRAETLGIAVRALVEEHKSIERIIVTRHGVSVEVMLHEDETPEGVQRQLREVLESVVRAYAEAD